MATKSKSHKCLIEEEYVQIIYMSVLKMKNVVSKKKLKNLVSEESWNMIDKVQFTYASSENKACKKYLKKVEKWLWPLKVKVTNVTKKQFKKNKYKLHKC